MKTYYTTSGEKVTATGATKDFGAAGVKLEVIYSDGSVGFEHIEDLLPTL